MTFDIPYMIVSGILILGILYATNHLPQFENMTKSRKALVTFVILFVALVILNLVWRPYGAAV
jgi:uncharacterized membrane protein YkvI